MSLNDAGASYKNTEIKKVFIQGESLIEKEYKSGVQKKWKEIDNKIFKPFFIYNYEERQEEILRKKM